MRFKRLVESEMITELSQDGKWVTFKNGQRTYIGKNGDIETGTLKGYNVNNKKAIKGKYKQLQDQAAKKKKQEEKAKKREDREAVRKATSELLKDVVTQSRTDADFDKTRKELAKAIKDDAGDNKTVKKIADAVANFGSTTKNTKKDKRKLLQSQAKERQTDVGKELSKNLQDDIKGMRAKLKSGGADAEEIRNFLKHSKETGYDFRKEARKSIQGN